MNKLKSKNIDIRDAFFDEIYSIAAKDKNVIFITADADALSLQKYKRDLPEQFINVGVAEQNMVTLATGLALSGKKVFIYAIIPFLAMRCYEHIKANICGMRLPVTIIGAGTGLSFENDGPTHHAIQDIAIMRTLPEITILNPCDSSSAMVSARIAYETDSPVYVRLDKGKLPLFYNLDNDNFSDGLKIIREISDINIISTGFMTQQAEQVVEDLKKKSVEVGLIDLYRIKPVNEDLLLKIIDKSKQLITIEENSIIGGIGSIISEILTDNQKNIPLKRIALEDKQYFDYGSREWLHRYYGLDLTNITKAILEETGLQESTPQEVLFDKKLTLEDFVRSFGTTVEDIPLECRELIKKTDFRYRLVEGKERDRVIRDVLKKIETDKQIIGAPERTEQWEKGWAENLNEFIQNGYDLNKIIPKFIRPNQPIRFKQQYIMPADANFEHDYFDVFRLWLFDKYLKEYDPIYDFGSGSGFNLVTLARMYPQKTLYGLDFVPSSRDLINKIAETYHWNMKGFLFDLRHPDESFEIKPGGAVFTSGTIEQIASDFEPFLQFLLKRSPALCVHIEPTVELYDENNLVDYLAAKFHRKRGYTQGYLPRLKELEAEGKIEILKVKRLFFGSLYMEGFTLIIWKLLHQ